MASTNNPLLLPVRKDIDTIRKTVLTNIIKMLIERKWLNKDNLDLGCSFNKFANFS